MDKELLRKQAVRRAIDQVRRDPRTMDFDQSCELSAYMMNCLRQNLAGSESVSEPELDRRVAQYFAKRERMERRLAASWRTVLVTKR